MHGTNPRDAGPWEQLAPRQDDFPQSFPRPELFELVALPAPVPSCNGKACGPNCQGACMLCARTGAAADLSVLSLGCPSTTCVQPQLWERTSDMGRNSKHRWSIKARLSLPTAGNAKISPKPSQQDCGDLERTVIVKEDLSFNLYSAALQRRADVLSSKGNMVALCEPVVRGGLQHPATGAADTAVCSCQGVGCGPDCQGVCLLCRRTGAGRGLEPMLSLPISSSDGLLSLSPRAADTGTCRRQLAPRLSGPLPALLASTNRLDACHKTGLPTRQSAPLFRRVRSAQPRDVTAAVADLTGAQPDSPRQSASPPVPHSLAGLPLAGETGSLGPQRLNTHSLAALTPPLPGQEGPVIDPVQAYADLHPWTGVVTQAVDPWFNKRPSLAASQRCRPSGTACVSVSEYSNRSQSRPGLAGLQLCADSCSTSPHQTGAGAAVHPRQAGAQQCKARVSARKPWLRSLLGCNCLQSGSEHVVFDTLPIHKHVRAAAEITYSTKVIPFNWSEADENGSWCLHAVSDHHTLDSQDGVGAGHACDHEDAERWDGTRRSCESLQPGSTIMEVYNTPIETGKRVSPVNMVDLDRPQGAANLCAKAPTTGQRNSW